MTSRDLSDIAAAAARPSAQGLSSQPGAAAPSRELPPAVFLFALCVAALLGAALMAYATRDGMGLSLDSDAYLTAARQLLEGKGFTQEGSSGPQPLTHFPPLFSVLLAGFGWIGIELTTAARGMNLVLVFASVLLAGWMLRRGVGVSRWTALVGAAAMALSVDLLFVHAMVWTEGLFIFLMLIALGLLGSFLDCPRRGVLIAAAAVTALALLTRYAGAALVIAGGVTLLVCGVGARRQRIGDLALFAAISCVPTAGWAVRNMLLAGNAANRRFAWHPPDQDLLEMGVRTLAEWLWPAPSDLLMWLGFGVVMAWMAVAMLSARNARREGRRPRSAGGPAGGAAAALACFAFVYVLFLLVSITFFDAHSPLDGRILAPLFVAAMLGVVAEWSRSRPSSAPGWWARRWPIILTTLAALFLAGQVYRTVTWAADAPSLHLGYGTRFWVESDLIAYVRTLPAHAPVYSNGRSVIHLHTGRVVKPVPGKIDPSTRQPHTNLEQRLNAMERDLRERDGYIIYFSTIRHRTLVQEDDLRGELDLLLIYSGRDGNVYQWKRDKQAKGRAAIARARAAREAKAAREVRARKARAKRRAQESR